MPASGRALAPEVTLGSSTDEDEKSQQPWKTLLWDDPVNTMGQVIFVLTKELGMQRLQAEAAMFEAHTNGKAVVYSGEREEAERRALLLFKWLLQATVEQ